MTNRITVVGSINVDNILHIATLPQPGETIAMTAFSKAPGGKGANQAVAAARSGAETAFIGRVGQDENGQLMHDQLQANGIGLTGVATSETQTGQAYILLQASGQNSIIVQAGANGLLTAADVQQHADTIATSDFVITQLETPVAAAEAAFQSARDHHTVTILNPAPANAKVTAELLAFADLVVPNETESQAITGLPADTPANLQANAAYFHDRGTTAVIITLGDRGSYIDSPAYTGIVPAFKVAAVDTTAAGDTFIGALAAELRPDLSNIQAAARYASRASSLTVQQAGAFPSIPTRQAITTALAN